MNSSSEKNHVDYIRNKGVFQIDCNTIIFSREELKILEKYGHWFEALEKGLLQPITEKQRLFTEVARGQKNPISPYETAWFKYKGRKKIELEKGNTLYQTPTLEKDSFYSREGVKQLRKTVSKTVWENHRKQI